MIYLDYSNNLFQDLSGENFDISGLNMEDMPNPEEMQNHINKLLGGTLGSLAHEIADEPAKDLNVDMENAENVNDVFQKLFKNPGKLINMVKKVGSKLDSKLKSGELKESELMQEASELMEKMKNMPGMKNMDKILSRWVYQLVVNMVKLVWDISITYEKIYQKQNKRKNVKKIRRKKKTKRISRKRKQYVHIKLD